MTSKIYSTGLRNVGSYQVSGQPYLSGSTTSSTFGSVAKSYFQLPFVSKRLIISNEDATNHAMVSFAPFLDAEAGSYGYTQSSSGSGNWLYLPATSSIELDVKCKEVFVSPLGAVAVNFVTVYAELTNVPTGSMYSLDGIEGATR